MDLTPKFIIIEMQNLPNNTDIVSVCKSFDSRFPTSSFDHDGNGIINMREVSIAIGNFAQLLPQFLDVYWKDIILGN